MSVNPLFPELQSASVRDLDSAQGLGGASKTQSKKVEHSEVHFVDVASSLGIDFVYDNGSEGKTLMPETIGGGVGCFDFDGNGRIDFCFVQGGPLDRGLRSDERLPGLYQCDASGRYRNVSHAAQMSQMGYGQGVAIGDVDSDGFEDIYLTAYGRNTFLRNQGDGTFRDATAEARLVVDQWSVSAAFADLTGDGLLDLYVVNYVEYDVQHPRPCFNSKREPRMCSPMVLPAQRDVCFVNQGDGTFHDESTVRGLEGDEGKGLGVAVADFNQDGLLDVYVANDGTANFMFINQREGKFEEQAKRLGCAVSYDGTPQASMGLAVGDYDGDQKLDIYSTHFYQQYNTLYRNLGAAGFQDVTSLVGLKEPTLLYLGFGTVMHDFDGNGTQELFVANGHIENHPSNPIHAMKCQLFTYAAPSWLDISQSSGTFFDRKLVGRGVALNDFDEDGDGDLILVPQNGPVALLRNESAPRHWLTIDLVGRQSDRNGVGCRIVLRDGDKQTEQWLIGGSSYASSHQKSVRFPLQASTTGGDLMLEVHWPSGIKQELVIEAKPQKLVVTEPLLAK